MKPQSRLLSTLVVLCCQMVMANGGCNDDECEAWAVLPSGEEVSEVSIPAGGYAMVRFHCPQSDKTLVRSFEIVGNNHGITPIAQVYHPPQTNDGGTSYVVLFRADSASNSGDVELPFAMTSADIYVPMDEPDPDESATRPPRPAGSCILDLCSGAGTIKFKVEGTPAPVEDLVSLMPEATGGIKVDAIVDSGQMVAWLGEGFSTPESDVAYVLEPGGEANGHPNLLASRTTFLNFPTAETHYRLLAARPVGELYELQYDEAVFAPIAAAIETSIPATLVDSVPTLRVPKGAEVSLSAAVSGGILTPGETYDLAWTGLDMLSTDSDITFVANSTVTVRLEATDSMGTIASAEVQIQVDADPVVEHVLTIILRGEGTVMSNPMGISCGTDCTQAYAEGTVVALQAVGLTSGVIKFEGGCIQSGLSDNGLGTVTMTGDQSCTVTFPENTMPGPFTTYCIANPSSVRVGTWIELTASASIDETEIVEWAWDFLETGEFVVAEASTSAKYDNPGARNIPVRATRRGGIQSFGTCHVEVTD